MLEPLSPSCVRLLKLLRSLPQEYPPGSHALVSNMASRRPIPDVLVLRSGLPKTRSGKIMRRILRKVAVKKDDELGDTSTLADPGVVQAIIDLRGK